MPGYFVMTCVRWGCDMHIGHCGYTWLAAKIEWRKQYVAIYCANNEELTDHNSSTSNSFAIL